MEPKEASWGLHTQEVTGSSPVAPTIYFNNLEKCNSDARGGCPHEAGLGGPQSAQIKGA
jgi:hypothetical protein